MNTALQLQKDPMLYDITLKKRTITQLFKKDYVNLVYRLDTHDLLCKKSFNKEIIKRLKGNRTARLSHYKDNLYFDVPLIGKVVIVLKEGIKKKYFKIS